MQADDLEVYVKIVIAPKNSARKTKAFGKGVAQLCQMIFETGSLNKAAKNLGIAYSKAWRIIHECEEALDIPLITPEGARGSILTLEGLKLLEAYKQIENEIGEQSNDVFQKALIDYRI